MREHFHEALERLDIPLLRKIWAHARSKMPQPANDEEALVIAHMARTRMESMRFRLRAYSHSWLVERGYPSQLPDSLRPRAERVYPITVPVVGIATKSSLGVSGQIRRAMIEAVHDAGVHNPDLTKRAILSARAKARRQLLGIV